MYMYDYVLFQLFYPPEHFNYIVYMYFGVMIIAVIIIIDSLYIGGSKQDTCSYKV